MGDPETRSFLTPPLLLFKENFSVSLSAGWLPLSLPLSPSLSLSLAGCGFEEANLCEWCGLSVVIALSQSTPFNLKRSFKEVEQSNRLEHSLSSDLSSVVCEQQVCALLWPVLTLCRALWALWLLDLFALSVSRLQGLAFICLLSKMCVSMRTNLACFSKVLELSEVCMWQRIQRWKWKRWGRRGALHDEHALL